MRRDYFLFGGVNSLDYNMWITGARTENTPSRDVSAERIPGRNGDLITDNGRWNNAEVIYEGAILSDYSRQYGLLMGQICSRRGYVRLEDSLRPGEYRLASFHSAVEPENTPHNLAGRFELVFSCKPQRYLKSGDIPMTFSAAAVVYNPTAFPAQPRITIHGSGAGTLTVGERIVEIRSIPDGALVLDCETMDAYWGNANRNSCIYAPEFPELMPGNNDIRWTGGITSVEIIPRWWTL